MLVHIPILLQCVVFENWQETATQLPGYRVSQTFDAERVGATRNSWGAAQWLVADNGQAVWREHATELTRYLPESQRISRIPIALMELPAASGNASKQFLMDARQWNVIARETKGATKSKVSCCSILHSPNSDVITIAYSGVTEHNRRLLGVGNLNLVSSTFLRDDETLIHASTSRLIAAAMDSQTREVCFLIINASPRPRTELKLHLRTKSQKVNMNEDGPIRMALNSTQSTAVIGGESGTLVLLNTKSGKISRLNLPNSGAAGMVVASLARFGPDAVLVGVRKRVKWNNGKNEISVPKLYKLDLVRRAWTYVGPSYLLGSSASGEWVLLADGPAMKRASLLRRVKNQA